MHNFCQISADLFSLKCNYYSKYWVLKFNFCTLERDWIELSLGEKRITIDQLLVKLQSFKVEKNTKISSKFIQIFKIRIKIETSLEKNSKC